MNIEKLTEMILTAGIPIDGVSANEDGSTRIDFQVEASGEQRAQALAMSDPKTLQAAIDAAAAAQAKAEAQTQAASAAADATLASLPPSISSMDDKQLRQFIAAIAQRLGLAKADGTLIQ